MLGVDSRLLIALSIWNIISQTRFLFFTFKANSRFGC